MKCFIYYYSALFVIISITLHSNIFIIINLTSIAHFIIFILLRVLFPIVIKVIIHNAHFLQLSRLIVHVKVESHTKVFKVCLLPLLERILEELEVVEEF